MMQEHRSNPTTHHLGDTFNMHSIEVRDAGPFIFKFVITVVRPKIRIDAFVHVVDRVAFNG
jgi:hypothetical protein